VREKTMSKDGVCRNCYEEVDSDLCPKCEIYVCRDCWNNHDDDNGGKCEGEDE
jgi:hypothetical protein